MMTPEEQLRTVSERTGFVRKVSKGMYYKTGEDVDDGCVNFIASCREHTLSRTHPDSEAKPWIYKTQGLVLFLMSKISVITTFMESRFRSPQQLDTKPMFEKLNSLRG